MDFGFTLNGVPAEGIVCWDRVRVGGLDVQSKERLRLVVDTFGRKSCRSQGLSAVITDLYRLQTTDHKLYLAISQKAGRLTVFGGIKTGSKKLFIRVETGAFCEIEPICVLDFYVNEDYQRQGLGKHLFEHCLAAERQTAASVGYDRPSPKLLAFLRKHYGLAQHIPQSNNFVVFSAYFQSTGQQSGHGTSWASVSQRPLTARRPHMRITDCGQAGPAYRHGVTSDTIPARRLSGATVAQHSGASSVAAFRTPANQSQQSSQLGPEGAGQKVPPSPRGSLKPFSEQAHSQESGRSKGSSREYGRPGQTHSTAASSIMYVKPPWAFDDPCQAGSQMQSMQQKQSADQATVASMPVSSWSSRVAAGQQRSGAGARDCLRW
ncbi:hypothetical protein WJX77_008700 [Trebouxia sp. C0004]